MRPEQVDAIRAIYDALGRRDLEALRSSPGVHPDFVWESSAEELDTDARRGRDSALAASGDLFDTFDRIRIEIEEQIDLGPDAAILVVSLRFRGAASGAEAERREAHLWTAREGRLASLREFSSVEEAVEAASA